MIAKLLSPILSVITTFLILALDDIWRDKRARRHKQIRIIVLAVMAITVVVNVVIVADSERTGGQLRETIVKKGEEGDVGSNANYY
jgi:archaellum biogenesis protein FlaJ (TadC family)